MFALNLETGETKLIADDPRADVGNVMAHPTEKTIQAVSFNYTRDEWKILDEAIRADLEYLATVEDGEVLVTSRTLDDKLWTVAYLLDDGPIKFYLYDRDKKKATFLFNSRDDLEDYEFVKMHTPIIKSRDGLNLVSYLSLPKGSDPDGDGIPDKPVPLVLDVHGGPWARDEWGFNSSHQWLAEPRLRRAERQLPWLDRLWQELRQRRQRRVVRQDARRPDRRRELGRRTEASPSATRSASWVAATAVTPRSSVSPTRPTCSPAASTSSARRAW